MKKIMFFVPKLGSGGIEQLAKQWYKAVENYGMKYSFVVMSEGGVSYDFFVERGYDVFAMKSARSIGFLNFLKQFFNLFIQEKFDIIHVPASRTSWILLALALITGCKARIIHAHTNFYNAADGRSSSKLSLRVIQILNNAFASCRLTGSKAAAEYCFGKMKKNVLIRNGIDTNKFVFSEDKRNNIRENLNLKDYFLIGNVGRFTEQKNQMFCVDILSELKKDYSSNCKLLLMGEGKDETILKEYARKKNVESDVLFLGITDDLSYFYSAIDAFVFPSLYEGLGIAAVEAQCEGLMTYVSEYVPDDAIASSSAQVISLSEGAKSWAKIIWSNRTKREKKAVEYVKKSGYDQNESIKKLMEVYLVELNRNEV